MSSKKDATLEVSTLDRIALRAQYIATKMIYLANTRKDKEKGDPKVGGHVSASASALHILGALHLVVKTGYDWIANKPHASPADHAYNYLLNLLLDSDLEPLPDSVAADALQRLRQFPTDEHGVVFQSYHSAYDPDHWGFLPSGTVGIPPVHVGYLALAYRYAKDHGYDVPESAHFWAVIGDSEFREGSLHEAVPEFAEREIGNLTWILDYNRQSLDGHRISNREIMQGTDAQRIERSMRANGWEVIQVQHGSLRQSYFKKPGGELLKKFLEEELEDYELQALLLLKTEKELKEVLLQDHPHLKKAVEKIPGGDLFRLIRDFGGHDFKILIEALRASQKDTRRPTLVIAHTVKGWNLEMAAQQGNHSAISSEEEIHRLGVNSGLPDGKGFARFEEKTSEGKFLKQRGELLRQQMLKQKELASKNKTKWSLQGDLPPSLDINLKMASYPHTQWMLGQLTAKLTRIANTPLDEKQLQPGQKPLSDSERQWKLAAELFLSMAPDVGTSTNLNPAMDGKIFGANATEDFETDLGVKDTTLPDLVPGTEVNDRFLRFEIVEANTMCAVGSFGKIKQALGIPLIPLMTVYDFFVKRAHDQFFYNLYWGSEFILVGTPSGVTLSPEGAQHGWKSDFQIPNQITWEPYFCQELDWIFCDAIRRLLTSENKERTGVFLRLVTRGAEQKNMLKCLKTQSRFKSETSQLPLLPESLSGTEGKFVLESQLPSLPDDQILATVREDVLKGAYTLLDYRGYGGYEPGDNVVHIFAMGALVTEALEASSSLLNKGIYANVHVVTSPDLLCGNLADKDCYSHLKQGLGVSGDLHLRVLKAEAELKTLSGNRVPIVSVHDGEPGLLDNLGSIVGVKQIALAVRKHSKCGRPSDVFGYHGMDSQAIEEACGKVLSETALEQVQIPADWDAPRASSSAHTHWSSLWRSS